MHVSTPSLRPLQTIYCNILCFITSDRFMTLGSTFYQISRYFLHNRELLYQLSFLFKFSLQKPPLLSSTTSKPLLHCEVQKQLILDVHHSPAALGSAARSHRGLFSTEQITIRGPGTVTAVISISLLLFWLKSNLFLMSLSLALHKGVSYKNGFFELRGTDYWN